MTAHKDGGAYLELAGGGGGGAWEGAYKRAPKALTCGGSVDICEIIFHYER